MYSSKSNISCLRIRCTCSWANFLDLFCTIFFWMQEWRRKVTRRIGTSSGNLRTWKWRSINQGLWWRGWKLELCPWCSNILRLTTRVLVSVSSWFSPTFLPNFAQEFLGASCRKSGAIAEQHQIPPLGALNDLELVCHCRDFTSLDIQMDDGHRWPFPGVTFKTLKWSSSHHGFQRKYVSILNSLLWYDLEAHPFQETSVCGIYPSFRDLSRPKTQLCIWIAQFLVVSRFLECRLRGLTSSLLVQIVLARDVGYRWGIPVNDPRFYCENDDIQHEICRSEVPLFQTSQISSVDIARSLCQLMHLDSKGAEFVSRCRQDTMVAMWCWSQWKDLARMSTFS